MNRAIIIPLTFIPTLSITECIHGTPGEEDVKAVIIKMEEKDHPDIATQLSLSSWSCRLQAHGQSHSCNVVYRTTSNENEKATKAELIVKRVNDKWILINRF